MDIKKIQNGSNLPNEFMMVVEIVANQIPVKYELDEESGALFVDRVVGTSMYYPAHYGFIPNTLGKDGDALDTLLVANFPIHPGSAIKVRPIGVIIMEDESGMDEKVLCVPVSKVTPYYNSVKDYKDLPEIYTKQLVHFFERYKDLENGKWVKVKGIEGLEEAKKIILDCVKNYKV